MTMKEYFMAHGVIRYEMNTADIIKYAVIGFLAGSACVVVWGFSRALN